MPQELIHSEYSEIMQKSYIDYAMSVIVQRALPDVRDGLKPVQRRTLYDMYELGIRYNGPYRKSARIVGDTMGKYHPHGDSSIYDALVVMAQDFKKEMPLVDGHGNFGSIEGDGAAAMRYTEARLAKVTQEVFLSDLDKDVVDFVPNFDETEKEPSVLPVRIPNILINGAEGIAVGMATSIPTHNPCEVIDLVINYMKHPDMSTAQAMKYVKGPDFPTGGIVTNKDDLLEIYSTGQGKIKLRGRVETEPGKAGHTKVVVTEIPYTMIGSGIGKFLADTAALQENHLTNDISDISNQSSKEGIRIVIDLKKGADVENFINLLYKKTKLEDTFGVNMLCVCDGRPETLGLVPIIRHHVDFQYELARRKYTTLLNKEREKKEVQEGLIKACDCIDLIIEILRGSKDRAMAENCLVNGKTEGIKFKTAKSEKAAKTLLFTKRQADAILDMRLYRLIGLEIAALRADYDKTMQNIAVYTDILENRDSMTKVIIDDLKKLRKEYAVPRKTTIDNVEEAVIVENISDIPLQNGRYIVRRVVIIRKRNDIHHGARNRILQAFPCRVCHRLQIILVVQKCRRFEAHRISNGLSLIGHGVQCRLTEEPVPGKMRLILNLCCKTGQPQPLQKIISGKKHVRIILSGHRRLIDLLQIIGVVNQGRLHTVITLRIRVRNADALEIIRQGIIGIPQINGLSARKQKLRAASRILAAADCHINKTAKQNEYGQHRKKSGFYIQIIHLRRGFLRGLLRENASVIFPMVFMKKGTQSPAPEFRSSHQCSPSL